MFGSVYWVSLILTNLNWNFLVPYCSESRDYFFLILAQHLLRETVTKNSVCESSFMSSFRIIRARWQCFDWQFNSQSRPRVLCLTSKMRTLGTRSFNSQYVTFAIRCVSTLSLLTPIILSFKFRFFFLKSFWMANHASFSISRARLLFSSILFSSLMFLDDVKLSANVSCQFL